MSPPSLNMTLVAKIPDAAMQVASSLSHLPGRQYQFLSLSERTKKSLADFEAARAGLEFGQAFFSLPNDARHTALAQVDCKALVAAADKLREIQIEAGNMKSAANRLAPSIRWPCERSAYDWANCEFGLVADVVRRLAGL